MIVDSIGIVMEWVVGSIERTMESTGREKPIEMRMERIAVSTAMRSVTRSVARQQQPFDLGWEEWVPRSCPSSKGSKQSDNDDG